VTQEPESAAAWLALSQALLALDDLDEALAAARQAVTKAPQSSMAQSHLAVVLNKVGSPAEPSSCKPG